MTMEIVKENIEKKEPKTKKMSDMKRGEVCYVEEANLYIIMIESNNTSLFPEIYLILDNANEVCFYGIDDGEKNENVRELYPNESITIKFS